MLECELFHGGSSDLVHMYADTRSEGPIGITGILKQKHYSAVQADLEKHTNLKTAGVKTFTKLCQFQDFGSIMEQFFFLSRSACMDKSMNNKYLCVFCHVCHNFQVNIYLKIFEYEYFLSRKLLWKWFVD